MDDKKVQLFLRAKAFLYENAPAPLGLAGKSSFVLDDKEKTASGKGGRSA